MRRLNRQKYHPDAVLTGRRQGESERAALTREKLVGNLNQDARAIARLRIAATRAPMRQVDQDLEALANDVVRSVTLRIDDEFDATSIVFVSRIVKTLLGRTFGADHRGAPPRLPNARARDIATLARASG